MSTAAQQVLDTYDELPDTEKKTVATEILRRSIPVDLQPFRAEERSPEHPRFEGLHTGLLELVRRGTARRIVRNDPSRYRPFEPALVHTTAQELLNWDRGDR